MLLQTSYRWHFSPSNQWYENSQDRSRGLKRARCVKPLLGQIKHANKDRRFWVDITLTVNKPNKPFKLIMAIKGLKDITQRSSMCEHKCSKPVDPYIKPASTFHLPRTKAVWSIWAHERLELVTVQTIHSKRVGVMMILMTLLCTLLLSCTASRYAHIHMV